MAVTANGKNTAPNSAACGVCTTLSNFAEMSAAKFARVVSMISKDLASFPMLSDSAKYQFRSVACLVMDFHERRNSEYPKSSSMDLSALSCLPPVIYTGIFIPNLIRERMMGCMG